MKHKLIVLLTILTATLLSGCYYNNSNTALVLPTKKSSYISILSTHYLLGSQRYVSEIHRIASDYGYKAALNTLMGDVDRYGSELDHNSYQDISNFYHLTSYLVSKIGYVDMKTHYFRNKLNRAPGNLNELLHLNSTLPPKRRWRLLPVRRSLYHMQGKKGEYNIKFISADGYCEAVYSKNGVLLTEKNDPVNMGTFNYAAGINERNAHKKYDVRPYLKWGNTENSTQRGKVAIRKSYILAYKKYLQHAASVVHYRNNIVRRISIKLPA